MKNKNAFRSEQNDRDQLINTVASDISATNLINNSTDFQIRNRYLSRIGAPVSKKYNNLIQHFIKHFFNFSSLPTTMSN